jgi:hypothetical protein
MPVGGVAMARILRLEEAVGSNVGVGAPTGALAREGVVELVSELINSFGVDPYRPDRHCIVKSVNQLSYWIQEAIQLQSTQDAFSRRLNNDQSRPGTTFAH